MSLVNHQIHRLQVVTVDHFSATGNKGGDFINLLLIEKYEDLSKPDIIQLEVAYNCTIPIKIEIPVDVLCRWLTNSFFDQYNGKISTMLDPNNDYDAQLLKHTKDTIELVPITIHPDDLRLEEENNYKNILTILISVDTENNKSEFLSCLDAQNEYDSYTLDAIKDHFGFADWIGFETGIYAVQCSIEYTSSWTDSGQEYDSEIKFYNTRRLCDLNAGFSEVNLEEHT